MSKILDKIISWGIIILVFSLPLFFLPITTDFFGLPKQVLILVFALLLLLAWVGKMTFLGRFSFTRTPFDLPICLLALVFLVSTFFGSPHKLAGFLNFSDMTLILGLTILYFVITNNIKRNTFGVKNTLIASACLLSLLRLLWFLEFWGVWNLKLSAWLAQTAFTPAGGLLPLVTFLVVSLVLTGSTLIQQLKNRLNRSVVFMSLSATSVFLITIALGTLIYQLTTTAKPILLPQQIGWQIAVESLKFAPLWGTGPQNFIVAFNQFRPLAFNLSDLWAVKFGVSSNWYFHLLTTTGILGTVVFLFLIWQILKEIKILSYLDIKGSLYLCILVSLLLLALFPPNILLLFLLYLLLACYSSQLPTKEYHEQSRFLAKIFGGLILLFVIAVFWFGGKTLAGEIYFKRSLDALAQNQGTETYNLQIETIALNPYLDNYRIAYSQTNLALAITLASQPNLSDQDRQNITLLVQQAIREGKVAIALAPNKTENWENLAMIYRQLINFAPGADNWAIGSYQQAIALDPTNPQLRLSLGGVYFGLQNWDEAIRLFEQTVNLKPNFANGHYNLSAAWREKGDFEKAVLAMENTLSLVAPNSDDWQKANSELEALKKRLAEKAEKEGQKPSETLTPPEPLPTGIEPPLVLPTGVEPEISPSPTPEATPTPES